MGLVRHRLTVIAAICTVALAALSVHAAPTPDEQMVLQELFTLGRSLQETRETMNSVGAQAEAAALRQAEAAAERDRLDARRRDRQAQFGRRLRFYQERGRIAPLAVLLGSSSFVDFLDRVDLMNQVLQHDAKLMAELRSLRSAVAAQAEAARAATAELEQLRSRLNEEEARLQAEIARREAVLASLQEDRAAIEAQLADLERTFTEKAEPILLALGSTLQQVDSATFEPDQVGISLFPPGATAVVSAESLTRFFGQVPALSGLKFRLEPGAVHLEGEFEGTPIRVGGRFVVAEKAILRYEPTEIQIREFKVPSESIAKLLAANQIDIDVSGMISPWVLKSVDVQQDELKIKAGIR